MAELAIKGDEKRSEEVIELLKALGGVNNNDYAGKNDDCVYFIEPTHERNIALKPEWLANACKVLSIDEFYGAFPYKVGDKVIFNGNVELINRMRWDGETIKYGFFTTKRIGEATIKDLQPYKEQEEIMEENKTTITFECKRADNDIEVIVPYGMELFVQDGKVLIRDKRPQYPKTYKDCCKVVGFNIEEEPTIFGYKDELLTKFQHLLICRDAYWKITGGWESDWTRANERKYCIVNTEGNITKWVQKTTSKILAFPTEEMRDAFYENFKELIESCKELL